LAARTPENLKRIAPYSNKTKVYLEAGPEAGRADTSMSRSLSPTPDALRRDVFGISFPLNSICCCASGTWVW